MIDFILHKKKQETAKRLLLQRLQQVKAQEKEAKRRRKAEKAVKKAAVCVGRKGMRMVDDSESSSSTSSESSDNERPPVLDRCRPPGVQAALPLGGFVEERTEEASAEVNNNNSNSNNDDGDGGGGDDEVAIGKPGMLTGSIGGTMGISSSGNSNIGGEGGRIKLEVCMGGRCQRSGADRLKAELERQVGLQAGTVVGCKCMGRCKHGPNVRLRHDYAEQTPYPPKESQSHPSSICCVGVGLEDVPPLVSSFLLTNLHSRPLPA